MVDTVTRATKTSQGLIFHQLIDENGVGKQGQNYTAVYGGIHWPSADSPSYFCIIGEEYLGTFEGNVIRGKVRLFSEFESESVSLDGFFSRVADDAARFHCGSVFAAMDELKYTDFTTAYNDYQFEKGISLARLEQAPFEKEFVVGVAMIQDFHRDGRLDLPTDSIVYKQLKSFGRHNLKDQPEEKFFAVDALRFALAALRKISRDLHAEGPGADETL